MPKTGSHVETSTGETTRTTTCDEKTTRADAFLAAIVESSDDAIISKSLDGTITSWNKAAEHIFGYRAEEIVGQPIYTIIPPELVEEEKTILARLKRGERIDHYETVRMRKGGARFDISLTISPIKDDTGRIIAASKIARDITERKRFDQQLQQERERLQVTLASIGDGVIVTDVSARIQFLNPVAEELTGWKQAEASGRPLEEVFRIFNERTQATVENPALRTLKEGRIVGLANDTVLVARDGTKHPIADSAAPVRRLDGTVIGAVLVFRDVGARRAVEQELRKFASVLNHSGWAVAIINANDQIEFCNAAFAQMHGRAVEEMKGMAFIETLAPEWHPNWPEHFERIRRGGDYIYESPHVRKDGSTFPVRAHTTIFKDDEGRPLYQASVYEDITEHKTTEDALRKSEALKSGILNSGLDAIITINQATEVLEFNPAAERIFGYKRQDAIGKRIGDLIVPPSLRDAHTRGVARYLATGESRILGQRIEITGMRSDGSEFPCELTVFRVPLEGPPLFTAFVRDITKRKRDEQALANTASQLRLVVEAAPNGMVMVDQRGVILMVNAQTERLFGYERAEMIGQPVEMLLPGRYRAKHPGQREAFFLSPMTRAMGHGRDLFARRKDGSEFPVEVGLNPAETPEGRFVLAAVIDITERKKIEHDLVKSAAQFRLVVESAPNGMVMVNEAGTILMVNSQMEKLFGYERSEMVGEPVEMLLPERYRARHPGQRGDFFRSPLTRAMGHGRDLFARRKDGSEFPVEVGLNPAETPDGTVVLAAVIDITQRKRMEADLAEAHEELAGRARDLETMVAERTAHLQATIAELEHVSYSLSHDMRAPLRTIHSFSQIVLAEAGDKIGPTEAGLLEKMINAASRLDRLIQDVLIYSRVARERIDLTSLDVERLLRQVLHERTDLQPPKAEIEVQGPLEPVLGHEAYLTQCITNLLDNAVKFVPEGKQPRVRIWSEIRDGQVRLWFEDNGIGIPKEAQERIFGMFQRIHGETVYPGTGIGLTIVRKAVERMRGGVGVESEPRQGSRFWLQLPRGTTT